MYLVVGHSKKDMRNILICMAKVTSLVTMPITFGQIVFGQNCILVNQPHEDFYFQWNLSFPQFAI
jgi:hypothetical protein